MSKTKPEPAMRSACEEYACPCHDKLAIAIAALKAIAGTTWLRVDKLRYGWQLPLIQNIAREAIAKAEGRS